jgi:hypothetical protein
MGFSLIELPACATYASATASEIAGGVSSVLLTGQAPALRRSPSM